MTDTSKLQAMYGEAVFESVRWAAKADQLRRDIEDAAREAAYRSASPDPQPERVEASPVPAPTNAPALPVSQPGTDEREDNTDGSIPVPASAIRELRKKHGWSQRKLAALLGVTQGGVGHWEKGTARPSAMALMAIGKLPGSDEGFWFGLAGKGHALVEEALDSNKSSYTFEKEAPELRRAVAYVGLFTRVAQSLNRHPAHVLQVAKGRRQSQPVAAAIIAEVRRIERETGKGRAA